MIVFWAAVLGLPTVLGLRVYCTFYISEHTHRVLGLGWVYPHIEKYEDFKLSIPNE